MRRTVLYPAALCAAVALVVAVQAWPYPEFARTTKATCAACHSNVAGGADLTEPGKMFKADRKKVPAKAVTGADYVGDGRCRGCHIDLHQSWQETRHARALEYLAAAPDTAIAKMARVLKVKLKGRAELNDACVVCHVTGFRLAGGYPAADSARTAVVASVSCEACHGPGSRHVTAPIAIKKQFINRNVTEATCRSCHTPATSPRFEFEDYKKRGVHALKAEG
jgi:Cytochrome c554 and c-prime